MGGSKAKIQADLAIYRGARRTTLELTRRISDRDLSSRPAGGGWSIGEIMDHLLLAERVHQGTIQSLVTLAQQGRRPRIRKSLRELNVSILFIPRGALPVFEVPLALANAVLPTSVWRSIAESRWMPIQAPTEAEPRHGLAGDHLRQGLVESLAKTEQLISANIDLPWNEMIFSHPLFGECDVHGLLDILALHERRHQKQISEVRWRKGLHG